MEDLAHRLCERHVRFLNAVGRVVPPFPERINRRGITVFKFAQESLLPEWQEAIKLQQQGAEADVTIELTRKRRRPEPFWSNLKKILQLWNIAVPWVEGCFEATFSSWSRGEDLGGFSLWTIGNARIGAELNQYFGVPPLFAGDDIDEWLDSVESEVRRVHREVAFIGDPPRTRKRKLVPDDDLRILAGYQVGGESQATLARQHGVSQERISKLLPIVAEELSLTLSKPRDITYEEED